MKRIFFLLHALVLIALGTTSPAQDFDRIQVKTIPLADGVYMLATRAGGNLCVSAGADGVLLVDSEYEQLCGKVKTAIAAICDKPVKYVLNTHWHFDHTGGNKSFAGDGGVIVAHENVRTRLAAGQLITIIDTEVPAAPGEALPRITFRDAITFHINGEEITALHFPKAHTDGDAVIRFKKANVIHTGDIVFYPGYPFIDISSGGSIDGMIAALEKIVSLCDEKTRVIPGHGPLTDKAGLVKYCAMLREFRAAIAGEIAAGKDLAAIKASDATEALDRVWGRACFPPDVFTEIVYLSLQ